MKQPVEQLAYTPPQVGRMLGVGHHKVLGYIRSGELRAVDLRIDTKSERPRYRILADDLQKFLDSRAVTPPEPPPLRRRRRRRRGETPERRFFP